MRLSTLFTLEDLACLGNHGHIERTEMSLLPFVVASLVGFGDSAYSRHAHFVFQSLVGFPLDIICLPCNDCPQHFGCVRPLLYEKTGQCCSLASSRSESKMSTEILVVGAGAVGAFYASRLASVTSINVSVICRSNYQAVKASGFHVTSPEYGDYAFNPRRVFPSPDETRKHTARASFPWNYVLVATKALPDVSDDSEILEGLVSDQTAIVLVQNGLGVEEPYAKRFPNSPVLSAVTIVSAAQPAHGSIKHNRWTRISIGPYLPPGSSNGELARVMNQRLVELFQSSGIRDAEAYDHAKLQFVRWHKIAINASMNPSSVLSGNSSNEAMSQDPELARHLKGVMEEILETAPKVLGAPFPAGFASPERILQSTRRNTSGSVPSMALDWSGGKRMELEVILGNPIRIARQMGIEMPRLQSLYALLRMAQEKRETERKNAGKL